MSWSKSESTAGVFRTSATRPRILQNGLATDLHLVGWIRAMLCASTFGLLTICAVLYDWYRRGNIWRDETAEGWGVYAAGLTLILLGSAALVLSMVTDGMKVTRARGSGILFTAAAALGIVGLIGSLLLLFYALPR